MEEPYELDPETVDYLTRIAEGQQMGTSAEHSREHSTMMEDAKLGFDSLRRYHMRGLCTADCTPAQAEKLKQMIRHRRAKKAKSSSHEMEQWLPSDDGPAPGDLYWNANVINIEQTKCRPTHARTISHEQFRMTGNLNSVGRLALREAEWHDMRREVKPHHARAAQDYFARVNEADNMRRQQLVRMAIATQKAEDRLHATLNAGGNYRATPAMPLMENQIGGMPLEEIWPQCYPRERRNQRIKTWSPFIPDNLVDQKALLANLPVSSQDTELGMDDIFDFAAYEKESAKRKIQRIDSLQDTPMQKKVKPAKAPADGQNEVDTMDTSS